MFECSVTGGSGLRWIALKGRIDAMSTTAIQKEFDVLTLAGELVIVADFTGVNYISSAGLRVFLSVQKQLRRVGGEIILFSLAKQVMEVFKVSGFDRLFRIFSTGDEVMSSLHAGTTSHEVVSTEIEGIAIEYTGLKADKGSVFAVGSLDKLPGAGYCEEDVVTVRPADIRFGTGLVTLGENYEDCKGLFGESMIIDRNLFFYPAIKHPAVDFMLDAEGDHGLNYKFLHGFGFNGPHRYILSFEGIKGFVELSSLIRAFFEVSDANLLGIVFVAESKGIRGMHLKRVPISELSPDNGKDIFDPDNFSDWINFPVEPEDVDHIIAGTGLAVRNKGMERPEIQALFSEENNFHIHAGVFEKGPLGRQLEIFEEELARVLTELKVYKVQHILGQSRFRSGMAGIIELEG